MTRSRLHRADHRCRDPRHSASCAPAASSSPASSAQESSTAGVGIADARFHVDSEIHRGGRTRRLHGGLRPRGSVDDVALCVRELRSVRAHAAWPPARRLMCRRQRMLIPLNQEGYLAPPAPSLDKLWRFGVARQPYRDRRDAPEDEACQVGNEGEGPVTVGPEDSEIVVPIDDRPVTLDIPEIQHVPDESGGMVARWREGESGYDGPPEHDAKRPGRGRNLGEHRNEMWAKGGHEPFRGYVEGPLPGVF